MLSNKTQNKIIIYAIIIFIIFIYASTWFIHNIVDIGSEGNLGNNGSNISGDNGENNNNGGNNNNGENNNSGNNNNTENNGNTNGEDNKGNNGNNNGNSDNFNPGIIIIPGDKDDFQDNIPGDDDIIDYNNRIIVKEEAIQDWNNLKELSVFENDYYNNKMIAPGVKGTYMFTVENMLKRKCVYDIKYLEDNPYKVNLLYRLRLNGEYIIGNENNWVKANDLSTVGTYLNSQSVNTYRIDWKWEDAENDTEVGKNPNSYYKMKIKVDAIEIVP